MSEWSLEFKEEAQEDILSLDSDVSDRIVSKLDWFIENFDNLTPLSLAGEWKGFFKFRVGDWRVIYEIDDKNKVLIIHLIDHRSKIYNRLK